MEVKCYILFLLGVGCVAGQLSPVYLDSSVKTEVQSRTEAKTVTSYHTKTVFGFLDFTTTVADTVMIFKPGVAPKEPTKPTPPKIETTRTVQLTTTAATETAIENSFFIASSLDDVSGNHEQSSTATEPLTYVSSNIQIRSRVEVSLPVDSPETEVLQPVRNNVDSSYVDYYSVGPYAEIEENDFQVFDADSRQARRQENPLRSQIVGLVTKLGDREVNNGITTLHETSVIGTIVNDVYAQLLHSTSTVLRDNRRRSSLRYSDDYQVVKSVVRGTSTRVINDVASSALPLEHLFGRDDWAGRSSIRPSRTYDQPTSIVYGQNGYDEVQSVEYDRKPKVESGRRNHARQAFLKRLRNSQDTLKEKHIDDDRERRPKFGRLRSSRVTGVRPTAAYNRLSSYAIFPDTTASPADRDYSRRSGSRSGGRRGGRLSKFRRPGVIKEEETTEPPVLRRYNNRRGGYTRNIAPTSTYYRTSSIYQFKLPERPAGRWRYKTTPKPTINIKPNMGLVMDEEDLIELEDRLAEEEAELGDYEDDEILPQQDLVGSEARTIQVTTITPTVGSVLLEVATIESLHTFSVGQVQNSRYITITTTKPIQPTVAPEIYPSVTTPSKAPINILEGSNDIATLPPIGMTGDMTAPPLETVTESFSTTDLMLKTSILPIYSDGSTIYYTLTQSYFITRVVTAFKTMPLMDVFNFIPEESLNEFNSRLQEAGSENQDIYEDYPDDEPHPNEQFLPPPDFFNENLENIGEQFDPNEMEEKLHPEMKAFKSGLHKPVIKPTRVQTAETTQPFIDNNQLQQLQNQQLNQLQLQQQLALLRLYNPYLGGLLPAAAPPVLQTSQAVVKTKTIYQTDVLPVWNGQASSDTTVVRPKGTTVVTEYEVVPAAPAVLSPINTSPINPLAAQNQLIGAQTVTRPVTIHTTITDTTIQTLKLIFRAKETFTTITGYKTYTTDLTTVTTSTLPLPVLPQIPFFG